MVYLKLFGALILTGCLAGFGQFWFVYFVVGRYYENTSFFWVFMMGFIVPLMAVAMYAIAIHQLFIKRG